LDVEGNFKNSKSAESKEGNTTDLSNPGNVFNYKNTTINPHYRGYSQGPRIDGESEAQQEDAGEIIFRLERDLQAALRRNIGQKEYSFTFAFSNR
jgi:hypothetical protein